MSVLPFTYVSSSISTAQTPPTLGNTVNDSDGVWPAHVFAPAFISRLQSLKAEQCEITHPITFHYKSGKHRSPF